MSDKYIFPHLIKVVNHPEGPEKKSELLHVQLVLHHLEQDHLGTPPNLTNTHLLLLVLGFRGNVERIINCFLTEI